MDVTCVAASLGDVPSSYQLLSFDQSKATWVNNSIFPRVVSVSDAIIAAKEFETSAVMLAVSS